MGLGQAIKSAYMTGKSTYKKAQQYRDNRRELAIKQTEEKIKRQKKEYELANIRAKSANLQAKTNALNAKRRAQVANSLFGAGFSGGSNPIADYYAGKPQRKKTKPRKKKVKYVMVRV